MAGGMERPRIVVPTGEELEKKQDLLSSQREAYFRLAVERGFSVESMKDISLKLDIGMPRRFSGEVRGKKITANKDSDGTYTVHVGSKQVSDDYLAEQLYEKYYPVARLMSMEVTSYVEPGIEDINELLK